MNDLLPFVLCLIFALLGWLAGWAQRNYTAEREADQAYFLGFRNGKDRAKADAKSTGRQ